MKRIGIYSGTFNPVHAGHISFAVQALGEARLDQIYLMPERHRSNKEDVTHFGHRVAMIRQAIKPHRHLGIIESHEVSFTVEKTIPKLQSQFKDSQLVFLFGSDSLESMAYWPKIERLLTYSELVVGIREGDENKTVALVGNLPIKPQDVHIINSYAPSVSSTKIREALRSKQETAGILASVRRYSNKNWLYISLA
jgi:nicotinate-nucleotide adenylyltransferase